ncbi:MAG TPA: FAD-binding oxidoreductase [Streptosporangiaceae bacterium]|nr:FAD-binding oxidoreductase [Streptosporangiaceae bacterium]
MTHDPVLRALAATCPAARGAAVEDTLAGVSPRYAASPATVEQASALLRAAAEHGLAVVVRGGGSKLDWGMPPARCDLVLDTRLLDKVVEHAASDLVVRVQAGVTLARLADTLADAGQQLALDPAPGAHMTCHAATVGGMVATGAAGPRRLRYGAPRDLLIGLTVVRVDGTVAKSGGKVVKNVAGYDLGKLFAGSYGTLGLIVEAVFRLHPLPSRSAYLTSAYPDTAAADEAVAAVAASQLAPSAVEAVRACRDEPVQVGVLLEGDADGVGQRAGLVHGLLRSAAAAGSPRDVAVADSAPPWWGWGGEGATLVRLAYWPGWFATVLRVVDDAAAVAGLDPWVGGSAAAGVVYASLPGSSDPAAVAAFVSGVRAVFARGPDGFGQGPAQPADLPPALASAVVVRAPSAVRNLVDLWGPVPSPGLMRAVKDQFDPGHRMSPGRFAGGI